MNWGAIFRVFAPKIIGAGAGALAGYVYARTKGAVQLDPQQITNLAVTMMGSATIAGKLAEIKLNPAAAAAPVLVQEGVEKKAAIDASTEADKKVAEANRPFSE